MLSAIQASEAGNYPQCFREKARNVFRAFSFLNAGCRKQYQEA